MKKIAPFSVFAFGTGRSYKKRKAGRMPTTGLVEYGLPASFRILFGVLSRTVIADAIVPPEIPPRN